jgi:hypothetical protein
MPLFFWLPYIIFSGMFPTPKADEVQVPVPVQVRTRD